MTQFSGKTIEEIAWHKAGIMKSGVPTLVDGCQTEGALEVLSKEADKAGCQMETIPPLEKYNFPPTKAGDLDIKAQSEFGPTASEVYRRNASLALQVSFNPSFAQLLKHAKLLEKPWISQYRFLFFS